MTDQTQTTADRCPSCGEPYSDGCMPGDMIASNWPVAGLCKKGMGLIDTCYKLAARLGGEHSPEAEKK